MNTVSSVGAVPLAELGRLLGKPGSVPPPRSDHALTDWQMQRDDAPILRYLFSTLAPRRHLEFGTWQGFGTCLCLEACAGTVWTLNLPDGESKADGSWAYGERVVDETPAPPGAVRVNFGHDETGPRTYHRTDAGGYIGRLYREKGLGPRVCQIYCDSREWDTSAYPPGFFDSVLVDGGHQADVVINDTRKALPLLRRGGLMLWHDFCPKSDVIGHFPSIQGVTSAIESLLPEIAPQFAELAWIDPSLILLGIKR